MRRLLACFLPLVLLLPLVFPDPVDAQGSALAQTAQTSQEKVEFAGKAIGEMRSLSKEVARMLESAQRAKDNARIQCLSKKLTTMRALLEVSETSASTMKQAFATGDTVVADHEHRKIAIALSKVRQLRAEAEACGGTSEQKGTTSVSLVDASVAYSDEEVPVVAGDEAIPDPPPMSQFQ
ncbi:MAG: hypothetical protein JXB39_05120 [Deltaproteobacteria bacterium]|nr:hypothetical protein [Deltaproteobacteria bacterium]